MRSLPGKKLSVPQDLLQLLLMQCFYVYAMFMLFTKVRWPNSFSLPLRPGPFRQSRSPTSGKLGSDVFLV